MRQYIYAALLAAIAYCPQLANAKTPGREYCFHGTCHWVKSLDETRRLVGVTTSLKASFYGDAKSDRYNPSNITSSGEYYRSDRPDNAASPIYPDGTKLLVWHPTSRKALTIRVNNAGPYWGDRKLDLSTAAADVFGFRKQGVTTVQVRVLEAPTKAEATYKKGRTYPSVKGYMGQYASLDAAYGSTTGRPTAIAKADPGKVAPKAKDSGDKVATKPSSKLKAEAVVPSAGSKPTRQAALSPIDLAIVKAATSAEAGLPRQASLAQR